MEPTADEKTPDTGSMILGALLLGGGACEVLLAACALHGPHHPLLMVALGIALLGAAAGVIAAGFIHVLRPDDRQLISLAARLCVASCALGLTPLWFAVMEWINAGFAWPTTIEDGMDYLVLAIASLPACGLAIVTVFVRLRLRGTASSNL